MQSELEKVFDQAKRNHNKRFGEFKFEYFGGSDVMNKLIVPDSGKFK